MTLTQLRGEFVESLTTLPFTYASLLNYKQVPLLTRFFEGVAGDPGARELATDLSYGGCVYHIIDTTTGNVFVGKTKHLVDYAVSVLQGLVEKGQGGDFFDMLRNTPQDLIAVKVVHVQWEPNTADALATEMERAKSVVRPLSPGERLQTRSDAARWLNPPRGD